MQIYSYLHPIPNTHTHTHTHISVRYKDQTHSSPSRPAESPHSCLQPQLTLPISVPATLASILGSSKIHVSCHRASHSLDNFSLPSWPGKCHSSFRSQLSCHVLLKPGLLDQVECPYYRGILKSEFYNNCVID